MIEKKYAELFYKYKNEKDKKALQELMTQLLPVIRKAIMTFGGGDETLEGKARLIAKRVIDNYDPKMGRLESYLMLNLQELRRRASESRNVISSSEYIRLQQKKLYESQKELEDRLGRPPSDQELADYLGLSIKKIAKLRSAQGGVAGSAITDMPTVVPELGELNEAQKLWLETLYLEAPPENKVIIENYFGLHGRKPATLEEIAKRLKKSIGYVHEKVKKIQDEFSNIRHLL